MKNAVVNYIISWLHAHTQTLSFNPKEIFQGINYLPLALSSVLGVWAFVQIVEKEDVKWSLQTGSWSTVREVVITCWGQICGRVVYSVRLENTSDRPTSRLCGRPESARQPFQQAAHKKKKKKPSGMWSDTAVHTATKERDDWQNPPEHEKKHKEKAKRRRRSLW